MKKEYLKYLNLILIVLCFPTFSSYSIQEQTTNSGTFYETRSFDEGSENLKIIEELDSYLNETNKLIDSVLVLKDGDLVYERFSDYFDHINLVHQQSTTKSVMSILIGIAIDKGILDINEPIMTIFSDKNITNISPEKNAITIEHLLQMQSGLQWNEGTEPILYTLLDQNNITLFTNTSYDFFMKEWPLNQKMDVWISLKSNDPVKYILDKLMANNPGEGHFKYNTGVSYLLSAILEKKSGMYTVDFADKYLFSPLNITEYHWWKDDTNTTTGGFGLWLKPQDMLKIGFLYLNNGKWFGKEIVSSDWIKQSSKPYHTFISGYKTFGYGYQWWTSDSDIYFSMGFGNQLIIIVPSKNMVIVITAREFNSTNSLIQSEPGLYIYYTFLSKIINKDNTSYLEIEITVLIVSSILIIMAIYLRKIK